MNEGAHRGLKALTRRVNENNNSSRCPINEHLGGPFMGKIMGLITMYVMLLSNYYATTQHSHGVITNFHDLQIFLCPASHRLTRVPCRNASLRTFAADLRRGATSGGNGTSSSD
jgi:hypothetical protein